VELIELVIVILMVAVNGVFAAYEIALASVSLARLQMLADQKRSGAHSAIEMKEGIEKSLAVVQLGITLVGLIAGATGGASATDDLAPVLIRTGLSPTLASVLAIALVVAPLTAVTIVLGELVPKLFALRHKEWVCLTLSPLMRFFCISMAPLVWMLESSASGLMDLTERLWKPKRHSDTRSEAAEIQELRAIVSLARASRLIGSREENIILGAARLASRNITEIMIPADSIRMLRSDLSIAENLATAHQDMHTRFPVCERSGDPQSICGYVTFKDLVTATRTPSHQASIREVLRQILSVSSNSLISSGLEQMMRDHAHIALVRDQAGHVIGMVALEDIIEELLGDIHDEYDIMPIHVMRVGDGWIAGGGATMSRIQQVSGIATSNEVAELALEVWMAERLGRAPAVGDCVTTDSGRFVVRKIRRKRVFEATLLPANRSADASPSHVPAPP
jgi:putative hemolysin